MELPTKVIIIVAIVVLTLVAITTFFLQSTGETLSRADAERVFATQCQIYSQQACSWDVTYRPEFQQYMRACRTLYGTHRDSYSCLYTLCQKCFETADVKCAGLCKICEGHEAASVDRKTCCSRYASGCRGTTVDCTATCPQ